MSYRDNKYMLPLRFQKEKSMFNFFTLENYNSPKNVIKFSLPPTTNLTWRLLSLRFGLSFVKFYFQ